MNFPDLTQFDRHAFDTETTGLSVPAGDRVFGFSVSTPDGNDYYWDIRETPEAIAWYNWEMERYSGTVYCHNRSFDYRMGVASGFKIPFEKTKCTSIQACLINEHEVTYSLDNLAKRYTKDFKKGDKLYSELAKLFGGKATKNAQVPNFPRAPVPLMAEYAKGDTRATLALADYQTDQIVTQGLERIVKFEERVSPLLVASEMHGVRVDTDAAERAVSTLSVEIKRSQKQLDDLAGFACNAKPSNHIKTLFAPKWKNGAWFACDGTPLKETDKGAASIDGAALRMMKHPAAKVILELRQLFRTRDTFLVGHVLESSYNGRVYPTVNQCKGTDGGTGTGRLSYAGPALQQIPNRNKVIAQIVKTVFLPDEGHSWVDTDMASFEVRMFAQLVGGDIIQAYVDNPAQDFHQFVADLTGLPRNASYAGEPNAKQLNLSMIFNQGDGTTADQLGLPWTWESFYPSGSDKEVTYRKAGPEAMKIIDFYHEKLPGVRTLSRGATATAKARGYLFTRYGRHLRFPNGYRAHAGSSILVQASSADENKENWIRIDESLQDTGTGAKMLLNTHDSYSLSVPIGEEEKVAKAVKERVEADRGLRVPLILEVQKPGKTWWESKSNERWM